MSMITRMCGNQQLIFVSPYLLLTCNMQTYLETKGEFAEAEK